METTLYPDGRVIQTCPVDMCPDCVAHHANGEGRPGLVGDIERIWPGPWDLCLIVGAEPGFSRSSCDSCGSRLGGDRYPGTAIRVYPSPAAARAAGIDLSGSYHVVEVDGRTLTVAPIGPVWGIIGWDADRTDEGDPIGGVHSYFGPDQPLAGVAWTRTVARLSLEAHAAAVEAYGSALDWPQEVWAPKRVRVGPWYVRAALRASGEFV